MATTRALFSRVPLILALAFLIAGCGAIDRFEDRMDHMNRSIDNARNNALLLNIMRARHGHPLTFVAITGVSGNQQAGISAGLPTFTLGPAQTAAQRQFVFGNNSVSGGIGGNLNLVPLESREFYQGLLQPIPLGSMQFLVAQGYPRQILFRLIIESIRLRSARGERVLWNDPTDPRFSDFEVFIQNWIASGVTIETAAGANGQAQARLCFDRALSPAASQRLRPACGTPRAEGDGLRGIVDRELGPVDVIISLRSTYAVFRYLGRLSDPAIGSRVVVAGERAGGLVLGDDRRLFPVNGASVRTQCVAQAVYMAEVACVPAVGAEQGPKILQLLTQLVALNTSVRDLPAIQAVRVTN